jgi:hypothetical protein
VFWSEAGSPKFQAYEAIPSESGSLEPLASNVTVTGAEPAFRPGSTVKVAVGALLFTVTGVVLLVVR